MRRDVLFDVVLDVLVRNRVAVAVGRVAWLLLVRRDAADEGADLDVDVVAGVAVAVVVGGTTPCGASPSGADVNNAVSASLSGDMRSSTSSDTRSRHMSCTSSGTAIPSNVGLEFTSISHGMKSSLSM